MSSVDEQTALDALNTSDISAQGVQESVAATSRAPLGVRLLLIFASVTALFAGLVLSMNLFIASIYNSATQQLNDDISQYSLDNPDLSMLAANQAVADDQFSQANALGWLQLPSLRQSVAHNTSVSAELTKKIQEDLNGSSSQSSSQSSSSTNSPSGTNNDADNSNDNSSSNSDTSQQNQDEQERMRTLTDNNAHNQQAYEPQAPKNTTKKPW